LLLYIVLSVIKNFFPDLASSVNVGGGNKGSTAILSYNQSYLNAFSSIDGIILPSKGEESSRQGLVFA
jgi:hypothetical protein